MNKYYRDMDERFHHPLPKEGDSRLTKNFCGTLLQLLRFITSYFSVESDLKSRKF